MTDLILKIQNRIYYRLMNPSGEVIGGSLALGDTLSQTLKAE